jgi:hypothetical protein
MGKVPPLPNTTIVFNKEDLFYALLRLYQMINDADPHSDTTDDDDDVVFEEDQGSGEEETVEPEVPPPTYFQKLYADQNDFRVSVVNEYIGLFALFSSPLDDDPKLKKEFIAYAAERGEDIEFTNEKTPPPGPKLFIVPPQKSGPNGGSKKPPKK